MDLFFKGYIEFTPKFTDGKYLNLEEIERALLGLGFSKTGETIWIKHTRESTLNGYSVHENLEFRYKLTIYPIFKLPHDSIDERVWRAYLESFDTELADIFTIYIHNPKETKGPLPQGPALRGYARHGSKFGIAYHHYTALNFPFPEMEFDFILPWEPLIAKLGFKPLKPEEWIDYVMNKRTVEDIVKRVIPQGTECTDFPVSNFYQQFKEKKSKEQGPRIKPSGDKYSDIPPVIKL